MKQKNNLRPTILLIMISILGSSCGLIEKYKTSEQPTDSSTTDSVVMNEPTTNVHADDLFSKSMDDSSKEVPVNIGSDSPINIGQEDLKAISKEDYNEISENQSSAEAMVKTSPIKVEESALEIKSESPLADSHQSIADDSKVMIYKVQKVETLMQIAFKIYGDISKWKDIVELNKLKFSKNSALKINMELKYIAPEQPFVWNPEGIPYMIKNGETLASISNTVYQTPKKWKQIWENNKPLIKNPNIIYAGFTLYYKEISQRKMASKKIEEENIQNK